LIASIAPFLYDRTGFFEASDFSQQIEAIGMKRFDVDKVCGISDDASRRLNSVAAALEKKKVT
jgi:hypothetical protein